jgi:hypothetical protein
MRTAAKRRGSAMMIVAFTVSAVGLIVIAGVGLSGAVANGQSKLERAQEMKYVIQGAAELAASDLAAGRLQFGSSKTYFIGGNAVTVVASDNSRQLLRACEYGAIVSYRLQRGSADFNRENGRFPPVGCQQHLVVRDLLQRWLHVAPLGRFEGYRQRLLPKFDFRSRTRWPSYEGLQDLLKLQSTLRA